MKRVTVYPDRIKAYGSVDDGTFVLVTNSRYVDSFKLESEKYQRLEVVPFDEGQDFRDVLRDRIPPGAHILTILPDCLLHSIPAEVIGKRKLLIMACRSGRTDLDGIEHFLRAGEKTEPSEHEAFADRFFSRGEAAEFLELVNDEYGTSARFDHLDEMYEWHQQYGVLDWGHQQVFPAGEIACFLVPLKIQKLQPDVRFQLSGQLALRGQPIVQSGPPSFLIEDQERIFRRLSTLKEHAVILDVKQGFVTGLRATHDASRPAFEMLQALFEVDSRFRQIYEVGFSMNNHVELWPTNSAMNEVCGGPNGNVHLGLGMLPHTQYHLDMFCVGTKVLGKDREVIFGGTGKSEKKMNRVRSAACPCMEY
jgi:hypothetical protein